MVCAGSFGGFSRLIRHLQFLGIVVSHVLCFQHHLVLPLVSNIFSILIHTSSSRKTNAHLVLVSYINALGSSFYLIGNLISSPSSLPSLYSFNLLIFFLIYGMFGMKNKVNIAFSVSGLSCVTWKRIASVIPNIMTSDGRDPWIRKCHWVTKW